MSDYTTPLAKQVAELSSYTIAEHAGTSLNNDEAHAFVESIRDNLAEAIEYNKGAWPSDGTLTEIQDDAPDIYNVTRMMELLGTGAYARDVSEYAGMYDDIITLAGYALYDEAADIVNAIAVMVGVA